MKMSSLAGPISAFLLLFPIGIRRLWSSLSLQHRSPPSSPFRCRPWYFSSVAEEHHHQHKQVHSMLLLLRQKDLFVVLLLLPVAAFAHAFLAISLRQPSSALRAASLALFWILLLLLPLSPRLPQPDNLAFLLAALAFLADLLPDTDASLASPVDARAADLAAAVTSACAGACLALVVRGSALAADVALSLGVVLKGTWALQVGVTLQALPPMGCTVNMRGVGGGGGEGGGGVWCELEEDRQRAVAMLDLLFAGHAVAVAIICMGVHWAVTRPADRKAEADGMMTARLMMTPPQLELD